MIDRLYIASGPRALGFVQGMIDMDPSRRFARLDLMDLDVKGDSVSQEKMAVERADEVCVRLSSLPTTRDVVIVVEEGRSLGSFMVILECIKKVLVHKPVVGVVVMMNEKFRERFSNEEVREHSTISWALWTTVADGRVDWHMLTRGSSPFVVPPALPAPRSVGSRLYGE